MTQNYIGTKLVMAWQEEKQGESGYAVSYENGYTSWSPKDVFEKAYLPVGVDLPVKLTQEVVESFVKRFDTVTMGKTTIVRATLQNGFEVVESSACVDPADYDETVGGDICKKRIYDRVWELLGFLLQTAINGVGPEGVGEPALH